MEMKTLFPNFKAFLNFNMLLVWSVLALYIFSKDLSCYPSLEVIICGAVFLLGALYFYNEWYKEVIKR